MTTPVSKRPRGHPSRHPVDVFFGRLWLGVVKFRSGLASSDALEKHLEPGLARRRKEGTTRTRKYYGYEIGRRVPERRSIDLADAHYPGTARFFDSPLRTLLRGDPVSLGWVRQQLLALPPPVVDLLWEPQGEAGTRSRLLRPFDEKRADSLAQIAGFCSLEAAALLMKLGELISSPALRGLARETCIRIHPSLRDSQETWPAIDSVLVAIDINFPNWVFLRPDLRCDVLEFTFVRRGEDPFCAAEMRAAESLARTIMNSNRNMLETRLSEPGNLPVLVSELLERLRSLQSTCAIRS